MRDNHDHEQRVASLRVKMRYCKWCGAAIVSDQPPPDLDVGEYCSKQHMVQAAKMRSKRRKRDRLECPTPKKRSYYERGDVIVWAAIHNQYGYACQCGFYHLTSDVPNSTAFRPLNELVAKKRTELASAVAKITVAGDGIATVELSDMLTGYVNKHGEEIQTQINALWTAYHELASEIAVLKRPKPSQIAPVRPVVMPESNPADKSKPERWKLWRRR